MHHFSPRKNEPMKCGARTIEACEFSDYPHYETEEEAQAAWHQMKQVTNGLFSTVKTGGRKRNEGEGNSTENGNSSARQRRQEATLLSMTSSEISRYISSDRSHEKKVANMVSSRIKNHARKVGHVKKASDSNHCDTDTLKSYTESLQSDINDTLSATEALMFSRTKK